MTRRKARDTARRIVEHLLCPQGGIHGIRLEIKLGTPWLGEERSGGGWGRSALTDYITDALLRTRPDRRADNALAIINGHAPMLERLVLAREALEGKQP